MDLIWGYTGILSLGQTLFFALGGYALRLYLMRGIGREGKYQSNLPDFMVFLDWKEFPLALVEARHTSSGPAGAGESPLPGLLALVFGFFAFRWRIKGVYFSIITQAMTFASMLLFFRNETGFGGNNGFTDFKSILGIDRQLGDAHDAVRHRRARADRLLPDGALPSWQQVRPRAAGHPRFGIAPEVFGLRHAGLKLSIWTLSAVICGVAGALYVPNVGIINPGEMSPAASSIEIAIWTAVGGRGTMLGPMIGAFLVNGAKSWFTVAFPEFWLYFLGRFHGVTIFLPQGILGLFKRIGKPARDTWTPDRRDTPALARRARRGNERRTIGRPQRELWALGAAREVDVTQGAILYLEDITVSFDGFRPLTLSLSIDAGELRCIIGPNGAGKTTMMDCITGKTRPDPARSSSVPPSTWCA